MPEDLDARFEQAALDVTQLPKAPGDAVKLRLYALYKQAKDGDCLNPRPGIMDFVGKAKHDAWTALKGVAQDEAKEAYVALVEELKHEGG